MTNSNSPECCPRFNPTPWNNQTLKWENKRFVKDRVRTLFYMPLNFGQVITRLFNKVTAAGAKTPDNLCLSDHTSKWNMDIYLATDKEVPGAENVTLSGTYLSRVYEGDFKDTGKWCADFEKYAKQQNLTVQKWYMWYTTCPKCAQKYGQNYVVILGQV